jgi:hypothetical protein
MIIQYIYINIYVYFYQFPASSAFWPAPGCPQHAANRNVKVPSNLVHVACIEVVMSTSMLEMHSAEALGTPQSQKEDAEMLRKSVANSLQR